MNKNDKYLSLSFFYSRNPKYESVKKFQASSKEIATSNMENYKPGFGYSGIIFISPAGPDCGASDRCQFV